MKLSGRYFSFPRLLVVAACSLLLPLSVPANTIEGVLDGEERVWHVLERRGSSTVHFTEIATGINQFTIQGHKEEQFSTKGALSLSFMTSNGRVVGDAEVSYFPKAAVLPNYSNDTSTGVGQLKIETLEINGDSARIIGTFIGTLTLIESIRQDPKPDDTIEVSVRFDVTADRQKF